MQAAFIAGETCIGTAMTAMSALPDTFVAAPALFVVTKIILLWSSAPSALIVKITSSIAL